MVLPNQPPKNWQLPPIIFVNFISVTEKYTAGQFEKDAITKLEDLYTKNNTAILVGGSGLYVDAVCKGIDEIPSNEAIREQLNLEYKQNGLIPLQKELEKVDPKIWETINQQNPQRIIRALEVFRHTGKPYSFYRKGKPKQRDFKIIKIGLNTDREIVYNRINKRVDIMLEAGLLNEVRELTPHKHLNALNTVGYKEYFSYFNNEITLEAATELLKKNTRNFAKRQLTWFRKDKNTHWFKPNEFEKIVDFLKKEDTVE